MELRFRYRKPNGEEVDAVLINWREDGRYLLGFNPEAGQPRTYRKDRVVAYQEGCEHALRQPFVPPPPVVQHAPRRPEILFTGFAAAQRRQLESYALASGFQVVKSPTQQLDYLCCGPNAGPTKVEKARLSGAWILSEHDLSVLIETGELQDKVE
ncbi:BRCT domain-containing protein [Aquitalea sp. ASV11]|uniref:BRCT domain-containing protein n=1 Tax=Aquitalea sp. ASV11 TaxID=2795103 RepID=UPI0018EDE7B7|nr:BRCT domain-containing protein [Aquitalea sp. ASV11]